MKYLNPFRVGFQQPEYAWLACGSLLFVAVMALLPIAHIEKFGFLLAMGAGVYHLGVTVKAVASGQKNLAVLMFASILGMFLGAIWFVDPVVFKGFALEEAAQIVGGAIVVGVGEFLARAENGKDD